MTQEDIAYFQKLKAAEERRKEYQRNRYQAMKNALHAQQAQQNKSQE